MSSAARANPFHPLHEDLETTRIKVWEQLAMACAEQQHPWRLANLANIVDGIPRQRIVILRGVDEPAREVVVHTDIRSPKIEQLQRQPQVSWLFYDWERRIQLTLTGAISVHFEDAITQARWNATDAAELAVFLAPEPPGTGTDRPTTNQPAGVSSRVPSRQELEPGRSHFAVLIGQIDAMDVLFVRSEGNLRASFDWRGGAWQETWRAP
jgi:hypothetical protein